MGIQKKSGSRNRNGQHTCHGCGSSITRRFADGRYEQCPNAECGYMWCHPCIYTRIGKAHFLENDRCPRCRENPTCCCLPNGRKPKTPHCENDLTKLHCKNCPRRPFYKKGLDVAKPGVSVRGVPLKVERREEIDLNGHCVGRHSSVLPSCPHDSGIEKDVLGRSLSAPQPPAELEFTCYGDIRRISEQSQAPTLVGRPSSTFFEENDSEEEKELRAWDDRRTVSDSAEDPFSQIVSDGMYPYFFDSPVACMEEEEPMFSSSPTNAFVDCGMNWAWPQIDSAQLNRATREVYLYGTNFTHSTKVFYRADGSSELVEGGFGEVLSEGSCLRWTLPCLGEGVPIVQVKNYGSNGEMSSNEVLPLLTDGSSWSGKSIEESIEDLHPVSMGELDSLPW
eukprot:CAMPEP_0113899654 /NCGR_PEP_ID=MMETSP0780_2-20120614/20176_1 /TAXON_ID=652834 /ORGANISM="Palpitomonas bilix" /LENGTH=393 /DNA_ID=CAMNT_0000891895 /DNA_START=126 /DNA_END=1307 /DNA_ORIENTATION=+ /assembly_acc=CAM_ASM_000599